MTEKQLPGSGLPSFENGFLNLILKTASNLMSDRAALKLFQSESAELERLFDEDDSYDVFQPLLIPRVIGIEDSSREWSIAMVLEHLCLTNAEWTLAIESLNKGIVPRGEIDVALYKPNSEISVNVLDRFLKTNESYVTLIEGILISGERLSQRPKFIHPWFGYLGPHQWHILTAFHQRIHRRQVQKIVAMLGVT